MASRLYLSQAIRRISEVASVGRRDTPSEQLRELLTATVREVVGLLGCDRAYVWRAEQLPESNQVWLDYGVEYRGGKLRDYRAAQLDGLPLQDEAAGEIAVFSDTYDDEASTSFVQEMWKVVGRAPVVACGIARCEASGTALVVVGVDSVQKRRFVEWDLSTLRALLAHVAVQFVNARLTEQDRVQAERLQTLLDISERCSSADTEGELLDLGFAIPWRHERE